MASSTLPKSQEDALYAEINKQVHLRLGEVLQAFETAFIEPSMPVEKRKALKHLILDLMEKSFKNFHPKMKIAWAELVEMNHEAPKSDSQTQAAQKWRLKGYDAFEGGEDAFYPLDGEFDDEQAAIDGARKRLAELGKTQPSASSGGQDEVGSIQDRVYIVRPDGSSYRFRG